MSRRLNPRRVTETVVVNSHVGMSATGPLSGEPVALRAAWSAQTELIRDPNDREINSTATILVPPHPAVDVEELLTAADDVTVRGRPYTVLSVKPITRHGQLVHLHVALG